MVARRRALRLLLPAILLGLSVAAPARAGTASDETLLLSLINDYRVAHGVPALVLSSAIRSVAEWRSSDMIGHDYQGHQIPSEGCATVAAVLRQRGISFRSWGEIYAWNEGDGSLSATKAFDWWIGSSEHRGVILDPSFTELGVGAYVGTWASRKPACSGDSSGIDGSGVHMYTVDFIEGHAASGSGGSGGGGGTVAPPPRPTPAPRPAAAPVVVAPAAAAPTAYRSDRALDADLLGLMELADGPALVAPAEPPVATLSPVPGGSPGSFPAWLAGLGWLAVGAALAFGASRWLRRLRRESVSRAARSGSRWP